MVRDEAKKLGVLAKVIHVYHEDGQCYDRSDWHDVVVEAGLGIDRRTADSYYRLAKASRLIDEKSKGRWCKGKDFRQFLPVGDE